MTKEQLDLLRELIQREIEVALAIALRDTPHSYYGRPSDDLIEYARENTNKTAEKILNSFPMLIRNNVRVY